MPSLDETPARFIEPDVGLAPNLIRRRCLHVVFASTSGHTQYVVDVLIASLKQTAPDWQIEASMAERTEPQDLLTGDLLLLAAATWNTWGVEGQLNPHMWTLLEDKAKNLDLAGKPCAVIGLGDHRYFYTARAAERLQHYVETHQGQLLLPFLKLIDEPYGQEATIRAWGRQLIQASAHTGAP